MRQKAPLERALADPDDIGGEVRVAVGVQACADLGVDLRALAGEHEQLLDLALGGAVEDLEHLIGRVEVRLVRGEGAVLAVAPAGPRQRERQVAREGDAAPHGWSLGRDRPPAWLAITRSASHLVPDGACTVRWSGTCAAPGGAACGPTTAGSWIRACISTLVARRGLPSAGEEQRSTSPGFDEKGTSAT